MGIGAALIFPATLAIITNVFLDARERAAAIGIWSAVSGMAVAAGPIAGGWLLEHFWWGSVFFVNVPVVLVVIVIGPGSWCPDSREHDAPRLDVVGLMASIAAIGALVFTIIEAPEFGWLDARGSSASPSPPCSSPGSSVGSCALSTRCSPFTLFGNPRFSAASIAIASAFFGLLGFIFLISQYLQLVQRLLAACEAGLRTVPFAVRRPASFSVLSIAEARARGWAARQVVRTSGWP
jgi:hypothetical protein